MIKNLFSELRRRKVLRAGITYLVGAWVFVQVVDLMLEIFDGPNWVMQVTLGLVGLLLPVALAISWFYELTPEGFRRTADLATEDHVSKAFDRRTSVVVIALLTAGLALSLYGNFRSPPATPESLSILIANFDNQSGNPLFSGVLEDVLLVGLEVAPFINAYPRNSATAIAAEMQDNKQQPRTLDTETAMLVALQQGVNVVVGGTLTRANGKLTLAVTGINTGDQKEVFSASESVSSDTEILTAMGDLSQDVRIALGNAEKRGGAGEGESFTVTNLEAAAEYLEAQELQRNRRLEDAVTHYRAALQLDSDFARAYAGLALTEQYLGNSDSATANWQEALSRLDRLTERERLRTLGNYFMINQGNYEKALETYSSLVDKYPADNVAQNNLAVAAFYAMDFPRALEVGREVAKRYPGHSGYGGNLALYAMYAGRFDEALEVARTVIEVDPRSAYAHLVLALSSAVAGDTAAAEQTYRTMTGLDQFGRSIATEGLADLAAYQGKPAAGVSILDRAIVDELALNATQTVAIKQVMRAELLLQTDQQAEAREALTAAIDGARGDFAVLVPAAIALIQLGETSEAERVANELGKSLSQPKRAYALAITALIDSANGDAEAAIAAADTAIETMDLWLIRYLRATILLRAGKPAEAAADLALCEQRIGEGTAVFLNDRPSIRYLKKLEAAQAEAGVSGSSSPSG
ncbi:MAG: tetratricopeptide repeat protein [Woeseia sp.]